ncbi:coiled-coil domain-containing protein 158 [Neopelma chrysocephalum]|uniref:coiled-coil domain-containing protein 158 n=1 Tax=Neopelma chrysocephalum TaxID=114329 RepID=UPI000FCD2A07|nr:coiled-coil domain-containing protein 158 [Neopelma chrysocephalum]
MVLQSKLMEVQLERDALLDTRQKELQSQENEKLQLKNTIQELEAANELQEEMLREAESPTEHLKKMVHGHKEVLLELQGILMDYKDSRGRKLCEHKDITSLLLHSLSTATVHVLRDLDSEVSYLKKNVVLVEEELQSLKKGSQTQKEILLQQHQIRAYGVKDLEKQLLLPHSEPTEAHTKQDQCGQESGNLRDPIHQLLVKLHKKEIELSLEKEQNKRFWDQNTDSSITVDQLRRQLDSKNQQLQSMEEAVKEMRMECRRQMECQMAAIKEKNESIGRISSLSVQLEATKETLRKVDLAAKQMDLEAAGKTVSDLTACLQEKERALGVTSQELQELHSQLGSRMQELQHLKNEEGSLHKVQSECETLKLQVLEKERIIKIFQKQTDNMTQLTGQHGRAAGAMEAEESQLRQEINDWKLQVEELKVAKDEKEARIREVEASRLSELELEKVQLVNTCTERLQALKDVKQEKDQLTDELQAGRSNLAGLAEAFEDLKRDYQYKIEEMEDSANTLKMQLKSAQTELKEARTALNTVEGSAGNALEVAVRMQKQITAKRGQTDALQSKIKFLEEAMANTAKEKHYLREENCKLSEKLSCIRAENIRIAGELDILRAQDKQLKERLSKMETALDKVIQGNSEFRDTSRCSPPLSPGKRKVIFNKFFSHVLEDPYFKRYFYFFSIKSPFRILTFQDVPSKLDISKEEPLQDLKRILQELAGSDSDIPSVDLSGNGIASICSAARCYTSSPSASAGHRPSTRNAGSPGGAATAPQIASQLMESSEHTPRRLQNKMQSLEDLVELLQIKKQAMSPVIRTQEVKTKKSKEKEKKLSK